MGAKQGFSQRGKLERHMASHSNCKAPSIAPVYWTVPITH
jgi:hypothetical protein